MDRAQGQYLLGRFSTMFPSPASSRLEDLLDRSHHAVPVDLRKHYPSFDPNLPSKLLKSMMSPADFVQLRAVSKTFHDWVPYSALKAEMFKTLYVTEVHKATDRESSLAALRNIGKFCEHLTIRIKEGTRTPAIVFGDDTHKPTTSASYIGRHRANTLAPPIQQPYGSTAVAEFGTSAPPASHFHAESRSDWALILKELKNVTTITISAEGQHKWNHFTQFEATLISIRLAIEMADLPSFHAIRLAPIYAYDILFCRLEGSGPFGDASFINSRLWTRFDTLEVQIVFPFNDNNMSASEAKMFIKALHNWLKSFDKRLRVLKFSWVGGYNPDVDLDNDYRYNPLLLDMVYPRKEFSAPPILWANLEEVWLGNVKRSDVDPMEIMKPRIPHLQKFNVLHDLTRYDDADTIIDFTDADSWETLWCHPDPTDTELGSLKRKMDNFESSIGSTASSYPVPIPRPREGISFDDPEELKSGQSSAKNSAEANNDPDGDDGMFPFLIEEL